MADTRRVCRRLGRPVLACVLGFLATGFSSCKKDRRSGGDPMVPASVPAASTMEWVEMETLGRDKWTAIEGAADLEWNEETRILRIGVGTDLNGVRWAGPSPVAPYEVELEARRVSGSDFFCGLTFPVRTANECMTLVVGGWGGSVVGVSSIDGLDAAENSTGSQHEFENGRWYRIRLEVGRERLQAWIDDRQVVDVDYGESKLSLREGPIKACAPFGLATWMTSAEARGVRWRELTD